MGLKYKIGLGFFVVALLFLALVLFGNFAVKPKTISINKAEVISTVKIEDLQRVEEPTRYKEENLTRDLASKISGMIIEKNPRGPQLANKERVLSVLSTENFVQNTISDALKNFNASYFQPKIEKSELKIGENKNYFNDFQNIIFENFSNLTLKWENAKNNNFDQLVESYNKTIDEFYKLIVPENLVYIHQKEISLLTGQKRVAETLKNYESDPMQSLLALQYSETINKEFENLKVEIKKVNK